jgi:hypothetical protein
MNATPDLPLLLEPLRQILAMELGTDPSVEQLSRVQQALALGLTDVDQRGVIVSRADRMVHFDLLKAVTAVATVLASISQVMAAPGYVSWIAVLTSLGQLRGTTKQVSRASATVCLALYGAGQMTRSEFRKLALCKTMRPKQIEAALKELESLGCISTTADTVELEERVLIRL